MAGPPPQWQYTVSAILPFISGHLSAIGSGLLILGLWRKRHQFHRKPHLRLIWIMSLYDFQYSICKAWSFVFSPEGDSGWEGSLGNMTSCRLQGFSIQMSHGTGAYNALLSIYYYLTICHGMSPQMWWSRYEQWAHGIILVLFATLGAIGVSIRLYNPIFSFCFIGSFPPGCDDQDPFAPPCDRFPPQDIGWIHELFGQSWVQLFMAIVVVTNVLIYKRVHDQNRSLEKYNYAQTTMTSTSHANPSKQAMSGPLSSTPSLISSSSHRVPSEILSEPHNTTALASVQSMQRKSVLRDMGSRAEAMDDEEQQPSKPDNDRPKEDLDPRIRRERMVFRQCLLFTLAFILCYVGPTMFHLAQWIAGYRSFWQIVILNTFTPLQGFFNVMIYARPTYLRVRHKFPSLTRWQAFQQVFAEDPYRLDQQASDGRKNRTSNSDPNQVILHRSSNTRPPSQQQPGPPEHAGNSSTNTNQDPATHKSRDAAPPQASLDVTASNYTESGSFRNVLLSEGDDDEDEPHEEEARPEGSILDTTGESSSTHEDTKEMKWGRNR